MRKSLCLLTTMMAAGLMVTTSCKHDLDDYVKKPYTVSDGERLEYAQKTLKTIIDRTQDWVLTANYSVKVNVDANLDGIQEIAVLDGNPFVRGTSILAKTVSFGNFTCPAAFLCPHTNPYTFFTAPVIRSSA